MLNYFLVAISHNPYTSMRILQMIYQMVPIRILAVPQIQLEIVSHCITSPVRETTYSRHNCYRGSSQEHSTIQWWSKTMFYIAVVSYNSSLSARELT